MLGYDTATWLALDYTKQTFFLLNVLNIWFDWGLEMTTSWNIRLNRKSITNSHPVNHKYVSLLAFNRHEKIDENNNMVKYNLWVFKWFIKNIQLRVMFLSRTALTDSNSSRLIVSLFKWLLKNNQQNNHKRNASL